MSYADLIDDEGINRQFLAVLKPRRKVTGWTLHAGSVYYSDFDFGQVVAVSIDDVVLAEGSSPTLSASQFYYDVEIERLYVRTAGGGSPSSDFVVATYEMYFGTFDAHHNRIPTDSSSRVVYFEPVIQRSPNIVSSVSNNLFGFMPAQSTQIVLSNAVHLLERHLYDSSFNGAELKLYHWIGDLEVANVKEVFSGRAASVNYNDKQVTIKAYDRVDIFRKEFRNYLGGSYFAYSDFPNLDRQFVGRPIRYVYGLVNGFIPVNVDAVYENPTTSDNRDWAVSSGQVNVHNVTSTVAASPASTTTRTYLNTAVGFSVGDSVWLDRAVGVDEYVLVTLVNYGSNYIEHAAIASPMASGDLAKRAFVARIDIDQQGVRYTALYSRDYTVNTGMAAGTSGFSFTSSMEANLSIPNTLSTSDVVSCRVYGKTNNVTLGGPAFASNDSELGNLTNPTAITLDLLKRGLSIPESDINSASFTALAGVTEGLGIAIPSSASQAFPQFKDIFVSIIQSMLYRLFVDNDGKWAIDRVAPLGASDFTIEDLEIVRRSFGYRFEYDDVISNVIVEYDAREIGESVGGSNTTLQVSSESETAKFLHGVSKQQTTRSAFFRSVDADTLADHLGFLLGDRRGVFELTSKGRFFETQVGDRIDASRVTMPGGDWDGETLFTKYGAVTESVKTLDAVQLTIDDQKGVEDNAGSW